MSYDVTIYLDAGGTAPLTVFDTNMTSNVAPMWRLAGADLREMQDATCSSIRDSLAAAVADMEANPAKYEALNPPNGWGDADGCREFLRNLLEWCDRAPNGRLSVSW